MRDALAPPEGADVAPPVPVDPPPATDPPPGPGPMPVPNPVPSPTPKPEPPPPPPATEPAPSAEAPPIVDAAAIKASAEADAAGALAAILKAQAGIVPELVRGATIADVQASYTAAQAAYGEIKAQVLADLGAAIPGGRASGGGGPVPSSPYDMIAAGIAAAGNK